MSSLNGARIDLIGDYALQEGATYTQQIQFTESGGGNHNLTNYTSYSVTVRSSDRDADIIATGSADYVGDPLNGLLEVTFTATALPLGTAGAHIWDLYGNLAGGATQALTRKSVCEIIRAATP